jgi:hypothetical protein
MQDMITLIQKKIPKRAIMILKQRRRQKVMMKEKSLNRLMNGFNKTTLSYL